MYYIIIIILCIMHPGTVLLVLLLENIQKLKIDEYKEKYSYYSLKCILISTYKSLQTSLFVWVKKVIIEYSGLRDDGENQFNDIRRTTSTSTFYYLLPTQLLGFPASLPPNLLTLPD